MKKILETLKLNWTEYLIEMLVIVLGILAAFLLNNWNEDRKSEAIRIQLLESLAIEFESNLTALDTSMDIQTIAYSNMSLILERMNTEHTNNLDSILGLTMVISTFDPASGALNSAKTSGEVHLIQNKKLLSLLFSWDDLITDLSEEQNLYRNEQWAAMEKFSDSYRLGKRTQYRQGNLPKK